MALMALCAAVDIQTIWLLSYEIILPEVDEMEGTIGWVALNLE
jgi:hypothetical protein